jgi:hypothetical protein
MYSLIVTSWDGAWDGPPFSFLRERFGEFSANPIRERLKALDTQELAELMRMPALLAYETGRNKSARVARITGFPYSASNADLRISYQLVDGIAPISPTRLIELGRVLDLTEWEMNRTHWAVKDVDLLASLHGAGLAESPVERYDVALSFAGEDREYVERVAQGLREFGVSVFYDRFEEARLWGEDLYVHLSDVYASARYTVMFVSEHYAAKVWPNRERQAAQARALQERAASILPARFDDTEVPGLLPTVGYVDIRHKTPEQLITLILEKLGRGRGVGLGQSAL